MFRCNTENNAYDMASYKRAFNIIKGKGLIYDAVISSSAPFSTHVIARELKQRKIAKNWVAVLLDPFVFNATLNKKRIKKRQQTAQKILSSCDKIFAVRGIFEENQRNNFYPQYNNKIEEIDLPNLIETKNLITQPTTESIVLTYAGSFYEDIRNPSKMLDILSELPTNYVIQLIGNGCEKILTDKKKMFNNNLITCGNISYNECIDKIYNSNILINLGNTILNQTPSKVFEIISAGLPVINFYFSELDTSLYYFKKYPLALNINLMSTNAQTVNDIINFCNENKNQHLTYIQSTKNLTCARSKNVTGCLVNAIKELINN